MIHPRKVQLWHKKLHDITGAMIPQTVKGAGADDVANWIEMMRAIAVEMQKEAKDESLDRNRNTQGDNKIAGSETAGDKTS